MGSGPLHCSHFMWRTGTSWLRPHLGQRLGTDPFCLSALGAIGETACAGAGAVVGGGGGGAGERTVSLLECSELLAGAVVLLWAMSRVDEERAKSLRRVLRVCDKCRHLGMSAGSLNITANSLRISFDWKIRVLLELAHSSATCRFEVFS